MRLKQGLQGGNNYLILINSSLIRLGEIPSTMRKGYYYVDPKDAANYYEKGYYQQRGTGGASIGGTGMMGGIVVTLTSLFTN